MFCCSPANAGDFFLFIFCFYRVSFCGIICSMRKSFFYFLPILSCLVASGAFADWQYSGTYVGDGWFEDDGSRFTVSARGGASIGMGKIKNDLGSLIVDYYVLPDTEQIVPWGACAITDSCDELEFAGDANLGDLPPTKDYDSFSFAAGVSVGWTVPGRPQWRLEAGWDHISENEYNSAPLFEGEAPLFGGGKWDMAFIASGSVDSKISTDVISVMAFYDFFDGIQKPIRKVIPYIGFGAGYADTETILNFYDPYGDISALAEFAQYGDVVDGLTQFYKSEYKTANVAGLLSLGMSYGISENMFLDFGARAIYLPRVKWVLTNEDDSRNREVFSAENMIYVNLMLGLRFEF